MTFEVHLIADAISVLSVTQAPEGAVLPRLGEARTHYGLYPVQSMLTYWDTGKTLGEVKARAEAIARANGHIVRIKIEGLPSQAGAELKEGEYWEIHAKIHNGDETTLTTAEWDKAAAACAPLGVHLFWNATKPVKVPIINLRRYTGSWAAAMHDLDEIERRLEAAGLHLSDKVHKEHGVVDTTPEMDEGWLFAVGRPKTEFMTAVPVAAQ